MIRSPGRSSTAVQEKERGTSQGEREKQHEIDCQSTYRARARSKVVVGLGRENMLNISGQAREARF